MIVIRRLLPSDIEQLCLQDAQAALSPLQAEERYRTMLANQQFTRAYLDETRVLACAGIVPAPDAAHLGRAWALIGKDVPMRAWPAITADVSEQLALALDEFKAIETEVDLVHARGHAWARRLGFRLTGLRPFALPRDMPAALYTFTDPPHAGLPVSANAVLDLLDRTIASWLRHPLGTPPEAILKDAWPRLRRVA